MAKSKKIKTVESVIYLPTNEAKRTPRNTMIDGVRCGIGGQILTDSNVLIPEATQAQYKKAYTDGRKHLIYAEIKQSDS